MIQLTFFTLMKKIIILSFLAVGLCLSSSKGLRQESSQDNQQEPKPFNPGFEYTFEYNAQLSSGLMVGQEIVDTEQTAATRVQSKAHIMFQTKTDVVLRLEEIRIGYLNEELEKPERIQPMGKFEPKNMHNEQRTKLELPVQFKYFDGVVKSIQFHPMDSSWSKNMKRSVLNMVQLNLKKNNAQEHSIKSEVSSEEQEETSQLVHYKAFTIPEVNFD